ncbi:Leu/Phe/Val dehydrogenase [Pseudomonas sp. S36]|uniref:Leu/Phe/Val dehydrogenase n=1 Tax=Pseudomonas sp. S36 TaxID=2767447 RepID=UPI001912488E|nr:Glu/Leu/Phe/Val dehydrogenase [Pseudomonas sp. S36]MBK4990788.1 Glu/Leu/Phe/Val dehydrogenase [Pseudomonas sp. S36]
MFALMQSTRTQSLHLFNDPQTGLKAVVAIHNERLGPAMGGCRYLPYADDESAMTDAIALAQGMSYKAALAGLPLGGGKAVVMRNPHVENRAALFQALGRFIDTLQGRFVVAVDSGTSTLDMDCIAQGTPHVTSTTACGDPSPHAALGVFAGLRATSYARLGSCNLEGLRVAIQGLGNVGYALAEQLHAAGAELLVSDLDPGRVRLAVEQLDAHPVAHDALASTPCDIFAPCAVGPVLNGHSVMQLRCAAVAGAANNQLTNLQVADQLEARGILYAPDYVINAGGLIHVALTHAGESSAAIAAHIARIPARLTEVFGHAQAEKRSPARVAQTLAERLLYT